MRVVRSRYTFGTAPFRFSYALDRMQLPPEHPGGLMANGHGMATDDSGRIYYTFDPALPPEQRQGADMAVLLRWPADGTGEPEVLGPTAAARQTLAQGRPHGLIHTNERGTEFLYHINDGKGTEHPARIIKTTLEGEIIWESVGPPVWPGLDYLPTGAVLLPGTETLLVCDGYGSSFVHGISIVDGSYISGSSFGKLGDGKANRPGSRDVSWNTNHGIGWNPSKGQLLHCDRVGHRIVYTDATGVFVSAIPLSGGMSLPCSVDFSHDGRFYVICSLGDANHPSAENPGGCIGIFRQDNDELVSTLAIDEKLGVDGFDHPHDAVFLPSGDIAFCTWGTARVAYLKRLNARMQ
jgi:hypothetical protein